MLCGGDREWCWVTGVWGGGDDSSSSYSSGVFSGSSSSSSSDIPTTPRFLARSTNPSSSELTMSK